MPLNRPWEPLDRDTLRGVPDRYGVYELASDDDTIIAVDHGPLRDAIKEALAYGDAAKVRYRIAPTREAGARLAREHRDRLDRTG